MELQHQSRLKLIEASQTEFRVRGYADTTVDDICRAAGVTKGSFFHHFKSKSDLVLGAVAHWNEFTAEIFAQAPYAGLADPRDRLLGYVDFRVAILDRPVEQFTCLLGTLVQEVYQSHPDIRDACDAGMKAHIAILVADIALARQIYAPDSDWSPEDVGFFIQAVLQGSFIFAKAGGNAGVVRANLRHLRRHLELLLPIEA